MSEPERSMLTMAETVAYTGVPKSTLQRRVDAWLDGDRSPYAIKGVRRYGTTGARYVDRVDAERVRAQWRHEMDESVTADQYAAGEYRPKSHSA